MSSDPKKATKKIKLPGVSSAEAVKAATKLVQSSGRCMAHAPAGTKCKFCGKVH